jgi:hypothetical protein
MIGGVRIQLQDISKVPQYLSKNKSIIILQWGASFLVQHFLDTQCPAAENERITHEDFSISFRVASLSDEGCRLNPMGRNEGPLHYCVHPGLLQPAKLGMLADGSPDEAHVINVYVHLLDASKRRMAIIRKSKNDEKMQREAALNPKKAKFIRAPPQEYYAASRRPAPPPMHDKEGYPELPEGDAPLQWPPTSKLPKLPPK